MMDRWEKAIREKAYPVLTEGEFVYLVGLFHMAKDDLAAENERLKMALVEITDRSLSEQERIGVAVKALGWADNQQSAPASSDAIIECRCGAAVKFGSCCVECGEPSDH